MNKFTKKGSAFNAIVKDYRNYQKISDELKNDIEFNEFVLSNCDKYLFFDFNDKVQNNIKILRIFKIRFQGNFSAFHEQFKEYYEKLEVLELEEELLNTCNINNQSNIKALKF